MSQTTGKEPGSKKLEALWDNLLSRQPEQVRSVYASLSASEQRAVLAHLQRMLNESGWQVAQRASARAALQALENQSK